MRDETDHDILYRKLVVFLGGLKPGADMLIVRQRLSNLVDHIVIDKLDGRGFFRFSEVFEEPAPTKAEVIEYLYSLDKQGAVTLADRLERHKGELK